MGPSSLVEVSARVPDDDIVEDAVADTAGGYQASASLTSGTWVLQVVAFEPAIGSS